MLLACGNLCPPDLQAQPSAAEIMKRVAANQDRAQNARSQFVYQQKIHRVLRLKNGKLLREEFWTFDMIPKAQGTEKKFVSVKGRYWKKNQYLPFDGKPIPGVSLLDIMLDDADDSTTRDGIDRDLFPLTTEEQKKYTFNLAGEKPFRERPAYQIRFHPTNPRDFGWTGEALIDKEESQPVSVYTQLSRKLPIGVRVGLGTNVSGLGFSIQYKRADEGIWFPSTYGTEFGLHLLFMMDRTITESMENIDFRRTTATSQIEYK